MTNTIQTPIDTATEAEEFLHLDPADIIIGSNVRTDLRDTKGVPQVDQGARRAGGRDRLPQRRRAVRPAARPAPHRHRRRGRHPNRAHPGPRRPLARRGRPDRGPDGGEHPPRRDARDRDRCGRRAVGPDRCKRRADRQADLHRPPDRERRSGGHQGRPDTQPAGVRRPDSRRGRDLRRVRARPRRRRAPGARRTTRWGDSVEHVAQKLRDEAAERRPTQPKSSGCAPRACRS